MKLAESKRHFVLSEAFNTLGALGVGDPGIDTFIVNAFGSIGIGTGDQQYTGNEFQDPLVAVNLSVDINWGTLTAAANGIPTVRVDLYLIATNEQFPTTVTPRLTTTTEDNGIFLTHPDNVFTWQMNSHSVTVIKRKKMMFTPIGLSAYGTNTTFQTRTMKLAKKLRGKKQYETNYTTGGVQTQSVFLKGYNYYWIAVTAFNRPLANAVVVNPVRLIADRYVYFKDF